ncbi:AAA family ATPase [Listeria fleischmannii]|uniref:AAA family ATPase n=1 Tax=Listeria fleischmannii TaxID=1069827 RepID=UPI0016278055|nr:AAA family ATPase [Listeria fleischmannii]MBC1420055.1 AAA family ATPase [Listeria fleischmannii]
MAITICVGNYKGGVGKTKNNILNAYEIAKTGKKCLVIDLDPQGNSTTVLIRTKKAHSSDVFSFDKTLMTAVKEDNLSGLEVEIVHNLYLLPSYIDFANYTTFLDLQYGIVEESHPDFNSITQKKITHLAKLLQPLKEKYDYIFIDVPPTKSYITDSAVMASDYVLIVLQTQELSLDGATMYLQDLQNLSQIYGGDFEICGVLPVLMDGNASLDQFVLENAAEVFGEENIFEHKVPNMARLKRFDNTGIVENDRHDLRVIEFYKDVANELVNRIDYFEKEKMHG